MGDRKSATWDGAGAVAGAVLRPDDFLSRYDYARIAPDPRLAPWVAWYWFVSWDFPPGASHTARVLPDLASDLTVEYGSVRRRGTTGPGAFVTGPVTRATFDIANSGRGGVAGVRLRPGVSSTVFGLAAAALRDRVEALDPARAGQRAAPPWPDPLLRERGAFEGRPATVARRLDECLLAIDWPQDPQHLLVADVVHRIETDPDATSLARIAGVTGYSARSLQRLFERHLGVGVTWLVRRNRLRSAVRLLDTGYDGSLADLAGACGWYDQSHFSAAFRETLGITPAAYRQVPEEP